MSRKRRTARQAPLPGSDPDLLDAQRRLSIKAMRSHDDLPPNRRLAATIVGVDVAREDFARAACRLDGGRYLLGGGELLNHLGLK